ncbi:MAG: 1-(5-phosphoribosyl)-5-[(5-phosphoribosylamino)methylideneamino] imidazole-4-carboxamide isomerase [Clostridia bacterium]|nr:1-(5-phosphoribosyl)-5-[(5-phosphoribosylamino)methylideneamino] imidazole-4-carboxamide isomerase [Clostridia bacterium]
MKLIAGIDLKNSKIVQLTRGDLESFKTHFENPLDLIKTLKDTKVSGLHIVDLDGVFSGQTEIYDLLLKIKKESQLPIQFGGGIRNFETAKKLLDLGIDYIVLGTTAIKHEELLIELLNEYSDRIIVAADVYDEEVYIEGWEESSSTNIHEFLNTMMLLNVKRVMITDISRDGTMSGVNRSFVESIVNETSCKIILSGGISSDEDLEYLEAQNIEGAVVGTAIYEKMITL